MIKKTETIYYRIIFGKDGSLNKLLIIPSREQIEKEKSGKIKQSNWQKILIKVFENTQNIRETENHIRYKMLKENEKIFFINGSDNSHVHKVQVKTEMEEKRVPGSGVMDEII